jgi:membrane-bound serine protease (ClpP class)
MDFLLDPNIAYIGLVLTFIVVSMALLIPGTGVLEVVGLFLILYSGYAIYNLSINWLALLVLLAGVIPFLIALRRSGRLVYLVISILALVAGSIFLFVGEGWAPVVNPLLALVVSALSAGFVWVTARKTIEAAARPVAHNPDISLGMTGTAASAIHDEGSVQLTSELWSARSAQPIPAGAEVRVIGREGFTLLVEPVHPVEDRTQEPPAPAGTAEQG